MTYEAASRYVGHVLDDSGNGRMTTIENDMHASAERKYSPVLIGWQCGFEPMFVAVYSYLDVRLTLSEAEEMASEYLDEIGWFANGPVQADYRIRGGK